MAGRCMIGALLLCAAADAAAAGEIDRAIVGTWQLDLPGLPVYWVIRSDGVYRVHGAGARPRQAGQMQASAGEWSVQSPTWADRGTYRLAGEVITVTGQLGTGNWKRVWNPAKPASDKAPGTALCSLLSAAEVARALSAPVIASVEARSPDHCTYRSQLSTFDSLKVGGIPARREAWMIRRKGKQSDLIALPGIGEDAYAVATPGRLVAHILRGPAEYSLELRLAPEIFPATLDLPALTEVARAADRRLQSLAVLPTTGAGGTVSAPAPQPASQRTGPGGWIPGGNRPPQKGPKPFEGWPDR